MAHIIWKQSLNTGIDVIDHQHRRIVEYINKLDDIKSNHDRQVVEDVLESLVDYTLAHFSFEESMMEESGYNFTKPHKKVHELFVRKVTEFRERFAAGEDVVEELHGMLSRWLVNHIRYDDADYASIVRKNMATKEISQEDSEESSWMSRTLRRFFK